MGREVEVKYQVGELGAVEAALQSHGITLGPPVRQDDQAYAPAGWEYGQDKIGVPFARLRTVAGRHVLTVKRPAENPLSCDEVETVVGNRAEMHELLLVMGFYPTVRIVKVRRSAAAADMTVCVDEVDGLGCFLEVERMIPPDLSADVVQGELAAFVVSLGVPARRTEETYDSLLRVAAPVR